MTQVQALRDSTRSQEKKYVYSIQKAHKRILLDSSTFTTTDLDDASRNRSGSDQGISINLSVVAKTPALGSKNPIQQTANSPNRNNKFNAKSYLGLISYEIEIVPVNSSLK